MISFPEMRISMMRLITSSPSTHPKTLQTTTCAKSSGKANTQFQAWPKNKSPRAPDKIMIKKLVI